MPRNPKLMFQICQYVLRGFCAITSTSRRRNPAAPENTRHSTPTAAYLTNTSVSGKVYEICSQRQDSIASQFAIKAVSALLEGGGSSALPKIAVSHCTSSKGNCYRVDFEHCLSCGRAASY